MSVVHVEFLVEDRSTEAALRILLPEMLKGTSFEIYPSMGKADLLAKLPSRLRGYSRWLPDTYRIVVVVDRDAESCAVLKARLEELAELAGLRTRTAAGGEDYVLANRLAIEELEAWFFGEWDAVRAAYPKVPATIPARARYEVPDAIQGGTWEALEHVLRAAGYFRTGLRKIEAARAIAEHMDPARNSSRSFQVLRELMVEIAST